MGAIHMSVATFHATLSELLGIKAGLAVDLDRLNNLLAADELHSRYAGIPPDGRLRIESTTFEEIVEGLLFRVGRLQKRQNFMPGISLFHKYRNEPTLLKTYESVMTLYTD